MNRYRTASSWLPTASPEWVVINSDATQCGQVPPAVERIALHGRGHAEVVLGRLFFGLEQLGRLFLVGRQRSRSELAISLGSNLPQPCDNAASPRRDQAPNDDV